MIAVALIALLGTSAPPGDGPAVKDPIWAASWGAVPPTCGNIVAMVRLPGDFRPFGPSESVDAEALAKSLKRLPPGRRSVLVNRYCHSFWGYRQDVATLPDGREVASPWPDAAIKEIDRDWPRILAITKYCGGSIDLLVADFEEWTQMWTWGISDAGIDALRNDPRWRQPRYGTPALASLLPEVQSATPRAIKDWGSSLYLRWNLELGKATAGAMNEAIWKPAVTTFPGLVGSNYQGFRSLDRPAPDGNGHQQPTDNILGNAASPALYGDIGGIVNLSIDITNPALIARSGSMQMKRGPWPSFLICQQQARACVRSAPSVPLVPWIAHVSYEGDVAGAGIVGFPKDPRCYDENLRHVALLGTPTFLWWRSMEVTPEPDTSRLDAVISEINGRTLGRIREPADVEPISFLSEVVVAGGRRHDGRWVWRVSASPEVALLREVGTGREWAPTADTLGFWVDTAEKVAPRWEVARRRGPSEPSLARPVKPAPPP
jgi:hypothetical protein